jgi:hypothetical protein
MNKNAYEIRLDVLMDAHRYCLTLFEQKMTALAMSAHENKTNISPEDVDKIYPTKKEILETAELFYEFVSNSHK